MVGRDLATVPFAVCRSVTSGLQSSIHNDKVAPLLQAAIGNAAVKGSQPAFRSPPNQSKYNRIRINNKRNHYLQIIARGVQNGTVKVFLHKKYAPKSSGKKRKRPDNGKLNKESILAMFKVVRDDIANCVFGGGDADSKLQFKKIVIRNMFRLVQR